MLRFRLPAKWNDLLVGAGVVLFISAFGLCAIEGGRSVARKAKCAANLHQIGLAILLYQNDNSQNYPRAVMDTTGNPKPTWGTPYQGNKALGPVANIDTFSGGPTQPAANDVTAALFLLLRNEQIPATSFVCPETRLKAFDFGGAKHSAQDWTNWRGNDGLAQHLSYSYQNVYPSNAAIATGFQIKNPDATFAIASDMNPGGDAVLKVTMRSTAQELRNANSLNHGQDGQNVLYGDGHVEWLNNPFCGTQHDNIFTAGGTEVKEPERKGAVVDASPVTSTDSVMMPTAADIGYKGPPPVKALTPADVAKLEASIKGTYIAQMQPGGVGKIVTAHLTVNDKTIKMTAGPMTVEYNYVVTGSDDDSLLVNLTAPDTTEKGALTLMGPQLRIDMNGAFSLSGFDWHRPGTPAATTTPAFGLGATTQP